FSLTVGADSGPARPDRNRGRRLSCTVALAVAGALAAVTVGSAFLFDLMPGGSGSNTAEHGDSGTAPAATPSDKEPTPTPRPTASATGGAGQVTEVPKGFIGTWKGPVTEKTSGQPHGTLTAVFEEGKKGADVVTMNTTISALGVEVSCNSVAALTSGTDRELTLRERADPDRPSTAGLCTSTVADVHFTLAADGTLRYRSDERGAGLPYGTLTRSGQ
ncbi:MAG TPA: serine/threonine protein kinase, partial [Streptomyces sp.]